MGDYNAAAFAIAAFAAAAAPAVAAFASSSKLPAAGSSRNLLAAAAAVSPTAAWIYKEPILYMVGHPKGCRVFYKIIWKQFHAWINFQILLDSCPADRNPHPAGMHGAIRFQSGKVSDFFLQCRHPTRQHRGPATGDAAECADRG